MAKAAKKSRPFRTRFPNRKSVATKTLAANVRKLRKRKRLSQSDLAEAIGTDQAALSLIELGRANPTLRVLEAIAESLEVSLSALFKVRN